MESTQPWLQTMAIRMLAFGTEISLTINLVPRDDVPGNPRYALFAQCHGPIQAPNNNNNCDGVIIFVWDCVIDGLARFSLFSLTRQASSIPGLLFFSRRKG